MDLKKKICPRKERLTRICENDIAYAAGKLKAPVVLKIRRKCHGRTRPNSQRQIREKCCYSRCSAGKTWVGTKIT